jgi:hypothetical protein
MDNENTATNEAPISREEFEVVAKQVAEIHSFLSGIATALKSPMLAAMLPPQMRNMLP